MGGRSEFAAGLRRVLYVLLFLQCSASSFYDPARRALVPTIVTARDLPLATTLDSFGWSLFGAFAASLGGFAVRTHLSRVPQHSWSGMQHARHMTAGCLACRYPSWAPAHASCWMQ